MNVCKIIELYEIMILYEFDYDWKNKLKGYYIMKQ